MGRTHIVTDPVISVGTASFAIKVVEKVLKLIESRKTEIEIESRELSLRVPDGVGNLSLVLKIKSGLFGGKIIFNVPGILRVELHSLPAFRRENQAVSNDGGIFIFDASKLPSGTDRVLADFEYRLDDMSFLDALVNRRVQLDPQATTSEDTDSYWMAAQLKHPLLVKQMYTRLELQEVDLRVNVGVYNDVKTKIPRGVMAVIERASKFTATRDREKLLRLALAQRRDTGYATGSLSKDLRELTELFLPKSFTKFIEVQRPFRYFSCYRGGDVIMSSFFSLPQFMTVESRTDLSLDVPAQEGKLLYHKREVQDTIERIFV